jgi:hypothetical protein
MSLPRCVTLSATSYNLYVCVHVHVYACMSCMICMHDLYVCMIVYTCMHACMTCKCLYFALFSLLSSVWTLLFFHANMLRVQTCASTHASMTTHRTRFLKHFQAMCDINAIFMPGKHILHWGLAW